MAPIQIFGPDPNSPAFEYVFQCPESSVSHTTDMNMAYLASYINNPERR